MENNRSLKIKISNLKDKKILLPDFQRGFVWRDISLQSRLAASVLTKLPLGTLLLFESTDPSEYKCRIVGTKDEVDDEYLKKLSDESQKVYFLLDGQQRITVLTNIFSDTIFEISDGITKIANQSLYNRFFLEIPKYDTEQDEEDIFGATTLKFPFEPEKTPPFSSSQIQSYIYCESIKNKSSGEPFNYYSSKDNKEKLQSFCLDYNENNKGNVFLIPLFLLLGEASDRRKVRKIVEEIAKRNKERILQKCEDDITDVSRIKFILAPIFEEKSIYDIENMINNKLYDDAKKEIDVLLTDLCYDWSENLLKYLDSCLGNIGLEEIIIEESDRSRGIDIYENLNLGGVKLSVFDLLIARSAKTSSISLVNRIANRIEQKKLYPSESYFRDKTIKSCFDNKCKHSQGEYSSSYEMECLKNDDLQKSYTDAFMNVLSFIVYGERKLDSELKIEWTKRKKTLELSSEQINQNCDYVCDALDRALFFFQCRCGLRKIGEINYALMLTIVAYILAFDVKFNDDTRTKILDLLEAWYWSSIFSGKYDKDQNATMINDLNNLIKNVNSIISSDSPDTSWLSERKKLVLECPGFSDEEFLINGDKANNTYPKSVLTDAICQFYLTKGYYDLKSNTEEKTYVCVFSDNAKGLQIHHVIPLGSETIKESTDKLRKDKTMYLNFPMNSLYISPEANREILSKSLGDYTTSLPKYSQLSIVGFGKCDILSNADDNCKKEILKERYKNFKSELITLIEKLLMIQ